MSERQNPHDQFFKEILAQPGAIKDFLRYYLPEKFVRLIKPETAERLEDSFVDEDLKEHLSDLLFRVELKTDGEAFVYVLLEHKSSPDKWVALQLLRYLVRIWEKARLEGDKFLPLVFPVVFYHGRAKWRVAENFSALFDFKNLEQMRPFVPEFGYYLCDLAEFEDDELKGEFTFQAAMRLLKYIFREELHEQMETAFRLLMENLPEATMLERVRVLINYLLMSGKATQREVGQKLKKINYEKGAKTMETVIDKWLAQGEAIGVKKGVKEGLREGKLSIILQQLKKRFGEIGSRTEARIRRLPLKKIEQLSIAWLDFDDRKDLSVWLEANESKK